MHRLVRRLAPLALVTVLGCPLDIQVREEDPDDAGPRACVKDQECPDGQRCSDASWDKVCVDGPRVNQPCPGFGTCSYTVFCEKGVCVHGCLGADCRPGYQCAPDYKCVEACTEGPPTKAGEFCDTSSDCGRCGFCVSLGGEARRCHIPCTADTQCPGGAPGACVLVPGKTVRVCRPG